MLVHTKKLSKLPVITWCMLFILQFVYTVFTISILILPKSSCQDSCFTEANALSCGGINLEIFLGKRIFIPLPGGKPFLPCWAISSLATLLGKVQLHLGSWLEKDRTLVVVLPLIQRPFLASICHSPCLCPTCSSPSMPHSTHPLSFSHLHTDLLAPEVIDGPLAHSSH